MTKSATGSQSFERAVAVLRIVANGADGLRLSDIVTQSRLKKATVHRMLRAMQREGFIDQDDSERKYRLGNELLVLGAVAAERLNIQQLAAGSLRRIATASEDTTYLSILRGTESVVLDRLEGGYPIRTQEFHIGIRYPLGVGAGSLAMFAAMPDSEIDEIIRANAAQIAQNFRSYSPGVLRRLIAETRERGYGLNEGMVLAGCSGIGVAVLDARDRPVAALSIGAIESRLLKSRQEQLGRLLQSEALQLSNKLRGMVKPGSVARKDRRAVAR